MVTQAAMAISPSTVLRGADQLFWDDVVFCLDLACFGSEATLSWRSGDLQMGTIGVSGTFLFSLAYEHNDVAVSVIADYQLDLWRLAISIVLIAREQGTARAEQCMLIEALTDGSLKVCAASAVRPPPLRAVTVRIACGAIRLCLRELAANASCASMLEAWTVPDRSEGVFAVHQNRDRALPTWSGRSHASVGPRRARCGGRYGRRRC